MSDRVTVEDLLRQLNDPPVGPGLIAHALERARIQRPGRAITYSVFRLPVATLFVAYEDAVLVSQVGGHLVQFETILDDQGFSPRKSEPPAALKDAVSRVVEAGLRFQFPVALERLHPFQRRVLETIRDIPRGEVRSYTWVAATIGSPAAVRAVGTALARNPIPVLIPCHRVVRADHVLGEYSGGGSEVKARILRWEGVPVLRRGDRFRVA
jgi:methylated-DNA-[protein]-cysteine S-methyltransferase